MEFTYSHSPHRNASAWVGIDSSHKIDMPAGSHDVVFTFDHEAESFTCAVDANPPVVFSTEGLTELRLQLFATVSENTKDETSSTQVILQELRIDGADVLIPSLTGQLYGSVNSNDGDRGNSVRLNRVPSGTTEYQIVRTGGSEDGGWGHSFGWGTGWGSSFFTKADLLLDGAVILDVSSTDIDLQTGTGTLEFNSADVEIAPTILQWHADGLTSTPRSLYLTQDDITTGTSQELLSGPMDIDTLQAGATSREYSVTFEGSGVSSLQLAVSDLSLSRQIWPDLCCVAVTAASGNRATEIPGGAPASLSATVENRGTAGTGSFVVAFYDGDPASGGEYLASTFVDVELPPVGDSGEATPVTVSAAWTVAGSAGPHRIYAVVDPYNDIQEADETNNTAHTTDETDLLISYWDEIAIDCGSAASSENGDIPYSEDAGYGYEGGHAYQYSGSDVPLATVRYSSSGELVYRFDNVSPYYSYNVDMSFYRDDGMDTQLQVYADGRLLRMFVADTDGGSTTESWTVDLAANDEARQAFATGYIPSEALGDGSVRVVIRAVGENPVMVSQIQLVRGGRIFIDCGSDGDHYDAVVAQSVPDDPAFADGVTDGDTGVAYGYAASPGTFAYAPELGASTDSYRFSPSRTLRYQFANLDSSAEYVLRATFAGPTTPPRHHQLLIDGHVASDPIELKPLVQTVNLVVDPADVADGALILEVATVTAAGDAASGETRLVDLELNEWTGSRQVRQDTDGDRMPDWWELRYANAELRMPNAELRTVNGLDPNLDDAGVDLDGDGFTNYEEYRASTSPVDGTSAVAITRLDLSEDGNEVAWNGTRFTRYAVLRRDDLAADWEPVSEIVPVRDGEIVFTDTAGDEGVGMPAPLFYRVRVLSRSGASRSGTEVETATVSSHAWDMPAQRGAGGSYLVCVPFLGITRAGGTVAGVFEDGDSVVMESVSPYFADITDGVLVFVRDGQAAGAWFAVKEALNANDAVLDQTPGHFAGDWSLLASGDRFTVHPLFRLSDLFGDDGSVLTAGVIDQVADKVHTYHDGVFRTFWLSDGTILDAGWVAPEERLFVYEDAILYPGTAVFVDRCQYAQAATAWASGEVLSRPLLKPLFPGYTFASVEYNESRVGPDGVPSMRLGSMGLEGRLTAGPIDALSDWLYVWDGAAGMYRSYWLSDGSVLEAGWLKGVEKADGDDLAPGQGIVILRRGSDTVHWQDGSEER